MDYAQLQQLLRDRGNEVHGIDLGLHRIEAVLAALGNPERRFPALHIAGTNGKGSVAAMSESILRNAGWRTGLYTSPHLLRLEERICVAGRKIRPRQLAHLAGRVSAAEAGLLRGNHLNRPLTYFEFVTCCAFLFFADRGIDIAVVEVGLGGRLDATNVVRPEACVITGVSLDHTELLGRTVPQIAREKAGIIKPGVAVVSGCPPGAARRVIRDEARRAPARLLELGRGLEPEILGETEGRSTIRLRTPSRTYPSLRLGLAGRHQARNAALAVGAVEFLDRFPATAAAVRRGLANVRWPGRMDAYRARRRTLLDGAHNPEGARLLADHVQELCRPPIHLVFGVLRDKDVRAIGSCLFRRAERIHLVPLVNSRTMPPEEVAAMFPRYRGRMQTHTSARGGLRAAWEACAPGGTVVVTGSLYLIGEVLETVRRDANMTRSLRSTRSRG